MSAIFAIYSLDGEPVMSPDLDAMSAILAHRGPDGADTWIEGPVGLGHRMLWVTPESIGESLPLTNNRGDLVITADARIDNREELINVLGFDRCPPGSITDSQLILAAYEKWREQCPEKLFGDFVFAIWNAQENELFCARDPFGVKHFYYYYRQGRAFALASEIKALFCLPYIPRELNELGVADHLMPIYEDKVITLYKDIVRLPAAHSLVVSGRGIKIKQYYKPDLSKELRFQKSDDYVEAFREIFSESVRYRLRSAYPVASMLSGGLDSSSVTCMAGKILAEEKREPLHTFSGIWPSMAEIDPKSDERRFMDAAISKGDFDPHFVRADVLSPLTDWRKMFWHLDTGLSAPNLYLDWAFFKGAHENGARVILGGTDGDTTISYGYQDLREFVRRGWWIRLFKEAKALSRNMPRRSHSLKKLVWEWGFRLMVPDYASKWWRMLNRRSVVDSNRNPSNIYWKNRPINPTFVERLKMEDRFWDLQLGAYPPRTSPAEFHWDSINGGMWNYILETFEKAAGAFSLEARYPFFDRKLIEFCLALPPGQKLNNGWTRAILRRAMEGILPPEIQWRPDKGRLSVGINMNLLAYERDTLNRIVLEDSHIIRDYINIQDLRALYERYKKNPMSSNEDVFTLLIIVYFALWLRESKSFIAVT